MFAVVRTGGKQYKVSPGDVIVAERLAGEAGATIELADILMVSDGAKTTVGTPTVAGAKIAAEVIDQARGEKIVVLKFKRRQRYRRTLGHRQEQTILRVTEISAPGMTTAKAEAKPKHVPKVAPEVDADEDDAVATRPTKQAKGKTAGKTAGKAAAGKTAGKAKSTKSSGKAEGKTAGKGKTAKAKKE
jgi:large subunit ribosomal protein L21